MQWLDVGRQRAVVLACDRGLHVLPRLAPLRVSGMFGGREGGRGGDDRAGCVFCKYKCNQNPNTDPRRKN